MGIGRITLTGKPSPANKANPSVRGQTRSAAAKRTASKRVNNPKAKQALSRKHPNAPQPEKTDYARFF